MIQSPPHFYSHYLITLFLIFICFSFIILSLSFSVLCFSFSPFSTYSLYSSLSLSPFFICSPPSSVPFTPFYLYYNSSSTWISPSLNLSSFPSSPALDAFITALIHLSKSLQALCYSLFLLFDLSPSDKPQGVDGYWKASPVFGCTPCFQPPSALGLTLGETHCLVIWAQRITK